MEDVLTLGSPQKQERRISSWVCLSESLDPEGDALAVFGWCARQLALSTQKSDIIRAAALERANRCEKSRQAARVCVSVLCDLADHGWSIRVDGTGIWVRSPLEGADPLLEKARIRKGHLIERDRQLGEKATAKFLNEMEQLRPTPSGWKSIFSLMRDGRELAESLERIAGFGDPSARETELRKCVDPYVQIVDSDTVCEITGLRLMDVWRYFRHTWTTVYHSTPGRKLLVLIRDRAARDHPVIGIGALGSAIVQLSARDKWIGWNPEVFLEALAKRPTKRLSRWLERSLDELVGDLHIGDFIKAGLLQGEDILNPTRQIITGLRKAATELRNAHRLYSGVGEHKKIGKQQTDEIWRQQAETYLFKSKRALTLATLLEARLRLNEAEFFVAAVPSALRRNIRNAGCRSAIRTVLRHIRAKHVGIDMLDITVCGAVAPYNELLAGKLVSLLMASPEVISAYRDKYKKACSVIASSMAGRAVRRYPRLVLLGTTSLYGGSASQYNRLSIPADIVGSSLPLKYFQLGLTAGFGSYQFSRETLREIELVAAQARRGREVNSIFGEGVNPKLRKVRSGLDVVGLPSDALLQHGSPRLVYCVPLAENFRDVLFGLSNRPRYILNPRRKGDGSQTIVNFWRRRWLLQRSARSDTINRISRHSLAYPVSHGARVPRDRNRSQADSLDQLELNDMSPADTGSISGIEEALV